MAGNLPSSIRRTRASPSQTGGKVVACRFPERWVAATDELIKIAVEDACSGLKQQMSAPRGPPHRLTLVKAFVHDLVDRGLHEARRDAFTGAEPLAIVHDVPHVVGDIRGELA